MCRSKAEGGQRCYAHTSAKVEEAAAKVHAQPHGSAARKAAERNLLAEETEHASTEKGHAEMLTELRDPQTSDRRAEQLRKAIAGGAKLRGERAAINERHKQLKQDSETVRSYLKLGGGTVPDIVELHDLPGNRVRAVIGYKVDASHLVAEGKRTGTPADTVAAKWFRAHENANYTRRGTTAQITYRITGSTSSIGRDIAHATRDLDPNIVMPGPGKHTPITEALDDATSSKHPTLGVPVKTLLEDDPDFSLLGSISDEEDGEVVCDVYVHHPTGTAHTVTAYQPAPPARVENLRELNAESRESISILGGATGNDRAEDILRGVNTYLGLSDQASASAFGPNSRQVQHHLSKMAATGWQDARAMKHPAPSEEDNLRLHQAETAARAALTRAGRAAELSALDAAYWDVLNRHPHQESFGNYTQRELHLAALAIAAQDLVDTESDWDLSAYTVATDVAARNNLASLEDWNTP